MAPRFRPLDLPPDPLELGRRLSDRPGFFLLGPGFGKGSWLLGCDPSEAVVGWDPEPALGLEPMTEPGADLARWVGLLPYEATRELERPGRGRADEDRAEPHTSRPRWQRYPALLRVAERVEAWAEDEASLRHLLQLTRRSPPALPLALDGGEPAEDPELHRVRIRRALELIREGELYQVNLARRFSLRLRGSPFALWEALWRRAPAPYAAYVDGGDCVAAGVSPEQLLSLDCRGKLVTSPIKGTRPRSRDLGQDAALRRELELDPKERAELAMVIDVERNDLGRVSVAGTVRLDAPPEVHSFAAVHHRLARVSARLRPGVNRTELFAAMLPSGSVTGAPKVRAMEAIACLESHRRGLYTGGIGLLAHDGHLELGMAIRTLTVRSTEAHYFAGGGIVADSDPEREVEETTWKAAQLLGLVGPPSGEQTGQKLVRNPLAL